MEKANLNSRTNLLKSLKQIGLTAQIHGIPRIVSNQILFLKILWMLSFLASLILCLYYFNKTLVSYFEYPLITNIDTIEEIPMSFPTVTICSLRPPVKSYEIDDIIIKCRFKTDYCKPFIKIEDHLQQRKTCYQFNSPSSNDYPLKIGRAGLFNNLKLKLFEGLFDEKRKEFYDEFSSTGFQIFIHDKSDILSIDNGLIIQPGVTSFISVKKVVETKLSEPYNNCIKDLNSYHKFDSSLYEEILKSNYTYLQKDCLDFAFMKSIGCSDTYEKFFEKCNATDTKVLDEITKLFKDYLNHTYKDHLEKCPLHCDTTTYQTTISQSLYPSYEEYQYLLNKTRLISKFPNGRNTTIDELRKSVYQVYIYFEDLKVTQISQKPKLDTWDLVSSIGGLFGLFLGVSFLSLIDIFQILFEIIFVIKQSLGSKLESN